MTYPSFHSVILASALPSVLGHRRSCLLRANHISDAALCPICGCKLSIRHLITGKANHWGSAQLTEYVEMGLSYQVC